MRAVPRVGEAAAFVYFAPISTITLRETEISIWGLRSLCLGVRGWSVACLNVQEEHPHFP